MKRTALLLLPFLLFTASFAQQLNFGITSSYNPTKIKGNGMKTNFHPGLTVGLYTEWHLSSRISLQPEVSYAEKNIVAGNDFKTFYPETAYTDFSQNVSLYYLNMPLLITYRLMGNWKVFLGPQYGYRLNSIEKLINTKGSAFAQADIGMVGGTQVQLGTLKIFGRYVYGISNINNINQSYRWQSRSVEIGAGCRFF